MASESNGAFIRNIAEVPWREFPNHFGGALSKPLVMPETAGSRHIDYRISMYQPMAHVARHKHHGAGADLSRARRRGADGDRGQEPCGAQARLHLPAAGRRARDLEFRGWSIWSFLRCITLAGDG